MKAISYLIVLVGLFFASTQLQAQTAFYFASIDSPSIVQDGLDTDRTTWGNGSAERLGGGGTERAGGKGIAA